MKGKISKVIVAVIIGLALIFVILNTEVLLLKIDGVAFIRLLGNDHEVALKGHIISGPTPPPKSNFQPL